MKTTLSFKIGKLMSFLKGSNNVGRIVLEQQPIASLVLQLIMTKFTNVVVVMVANLSPC
jgi:hypothetical protein